MNERFSYRGDREAYNAAKVKALESLLIEKGIISSETVNKVLGFFETDFGPFNGAKLVAKAWVDPEFKARLLADTPAAIAQMDFPPGMAGAEGEYMKVVENTPKVHNLIVCTLCSCYPWPMLGLPPYWYKDPTFRSRAVKEPRKVLQEFGLELDESKEVRVWDSSAQIRWFVRFWEERAFGIALALSKKGHYEWEDFRQELIAAIAQWEATHCKDDPSWDYYQRWLQALEQLVFESNRTYANYENKHHL